MSNIYLLSYPKSGSNWLSYIIENCFGVEVRGATDEYYVPCHTELVYDKHCFVSKGHGHIKTEYVDYDGMILLLRNYKRNMFSFRGNLNDDNKDFQNVNNKIDYIHNIQRYENFNKSKLVIYYEDLIADIFNTLHKLNLFFASFGIEGNIESFYGEIDTHRKNSLSKYKLNPKSKGNPKFYDGKLNGERCKEIDGFVKSKYPYLFQKYLSRYSEYSERNYEY